MSERSTKRRDRKGRRTFQGAADEADGDAASSEKAAPDGWLTGGWIHTSTAATVLIQIVAQHRAITLP
jgi:hypothetical protein